MGKMSELATELAELKRCGEVKELLAKYGANKLSEVDSAKYAELKAEAEVLGDG